MNDLLFVRNVALWSVAGGLAFALVMFGLIYPISLQMVLAASGLVSLGAGVVGTLVALSFSDEHPQEEH